MPPAHSDYLGPDGDPGGRGSQNQSLQTVPWLPGKWVQDKRGAVPRDAQGEMQITELLPAGLGQGFLLQNLLFDSEYSY